jgi:hypothetical protein
MVRQTKMKIGYFIEENKVKTSTLNQHGTPEQNCTENFETQATRN